MISFDLIIFSFKLLSQVRIFLLWCFTNFFLTLIFLMRSSKDVVIVEIWFFCLIIFMKKNVVYFSTLVSYERCSVSALILTSSFPIFFILHVVFIFTDSMIQVFFKYFMLFFEYLIRLIKHGLDFDIKANVWHKCWWCCDNSGILIFNECLWKIACYLLQLFMLFLRLFMLSI